LYFLFDIPCKDKKFFLFYLISPSFSFLSDFISIFVLKLPQQSHSIKTGKINKIFSVFLFILSFAACGQKTKFNLDFEKNKNGFPLGWESPVTSSNYTVSLDSHNVKSGKYSISIEFTGDSAYFEPIWFTLPNNYGGEKIMLSGYIKTENVTDGCRRIVGWKRENMGLLEISPSGNSQRKL
jgi:hypothetical protein